VTKLNAKIRHQENIAKIMQCNAHTLIEIHVAICAVEKIDVINILLIDWNINGRKQLGIAKKLRKRY